jgi:phosphoglycerate-specific signal transduction histidine kinase
MSVHLRLRLILGVLLGALLVVAFASALQFRNLALALADVGPDQPELAGQLADHANTAALVLALIGVLMLIIGINISRSLRQNVLDRLTTIDLAAKEIIEGEHARRLMFSGNDELARIARTLDAVLDQSDRSDAETRGRNREVRALLVALLHRWPTSAAITGLDGEIIVSTLSTDAEQILHSLTPRVRAAAKVLLSRGFLTASELETQIVTPDYLARVQALALGEQRIVGWLTVFDRVSNWPSKPAEPEPTQLEPTQLEPTQPESTLSVESDASDLAQPAGQVSQ